MRKLNLIATTLVTCAIIFINAPSSYSLDNTISFGVIAPLTGDAASYGNDTKNAIELALEDLQKSKDLSGISLKPIFEDGHCSGKEAASAAQKLININKVKTILGGVCSTETLAIAPIVNQNKVVSIASFSSSPKITAAGDFVFRNCVSDSEGGRAAAALVAKDGRKKVAIITEDTEYGIGVREVFLEHLRSQGVEIVGDEVYQTGDADLRSNLLRLRSKNPEAIFINPQTGAKGGLLIKYLREMNWSIPIYGTFMFSSPEAASGAGGIQFIEGVKFIDAPEPTSEKGKSFLERYRSRYPAIQSTFDVVQTYDAVFLIAEAVKAVGNDGEKIRDYLYKMPEREGAAFKYRFDKNGDVVGLHYVTKMIKNGRVEMLDLE